MKWRVTAIVSTALLVVMATFLAFSLFSGGRSPFRSLDAPSVITQVRRLKQLVTVRYSIQRVVGMTEPRDPVGSESILLMVQGDATAGVDLAGLGPKDFIFTGDRKVVINLPAAKLLDTYLDEKQIKVWDHRVTWWTPWVPFDPDFEHKARLEALKQVRSAALEMGILDQAQRNAESAISDLLGALNIQTTFEKRGF